MNFRLGNTQCAIYKERVSHFLWVTRNWNFILEVAKVSDPIRNSIKLMQKTEMALLNSAILFIKI